MTKEQPSPHELELGRQVMLLSREVAQLKKARELERGGRAEDVDNNLATQTHTDETAETEHLLFEAVFEQYPLPMVAMSVPDLVVRYINRTAIDFLGVSDEPSYIGLSLTEVRQRQTWRYSSADGTPVDPFVMPLARSLREMPTRNETSYTVNRKDGTLRYGLVNATPVFNSAGDLLVELITFVDITELKQAEEKIRQLANQQRTVLNTIRMGISLLKNRKIQWANPAFARMFGYETDKLPGLEISRFYSNQADYEKVGNDAYARLADG